MNHHLSGAMLWLRKRGWRTLSSATALIFSTLSLLVALKAYQLAEAEQLASLRIVLKVNESAENTESVKLLPVQADFVLQSVKVIFPNALHTMNRTLWPELASPGIVDMQQLAVIKWLEEFHADDLKKVPLAIGSLDVPLVITADYIARGRRIDSTAAYDAQYFYAIGPAVTGGPSATVTRLTFLREVSKDDDLQALVDAEFLKKRPKGAF